MTLDEAIKHCEEVENSCDNPQCAKEHWQLAKWLRELKDYRQRVKISKSADSLTRDTVSEELVQAAIDYCGGNKGADARVRTAFMEGARWQREQMMEQAVESEVAATTPGINGDWSDYIVKYPIGKRPFEKGDKVKLVIIKEA